MKKIICVMIAAIVICSSSYLPEDAFAKNTMGITVYASETVCTAPTGLKADLSGSVVKLSWNRVSGADSYRVYIYDSKDKKYKKYRDINDNSLVIDNLNGGKTYFFKVASVRNGIVGKKSAKVKAFVPISPKKWVNAYKKVLIEYKNGTKPNLGYFMCSLYDITGDGTPELFVSDGNAHISGVEIYSYSDGKVTHFAKKSKFDDEMYYKFGSFGVVFYCPENGLLIDSYTGQGVLTATFYSFKGGNMKEVISLVDAGAALPEQYYLINGKKVSKQELDRNFKKYDGETIMLGTSFVITEKEGFEDIMTVDEVWDKILNENWTGYSDMVDMVG